jgi:aldehyde:ferredoxin oxidoreductase
MPESMRGPFVAPSTPRVLDLPLSQLTSSAGSARAWSAGEPALASLAAAGGSALAVVLAWQHRSEPALILSVGEAVVHGIPTAARACVAGRAPLFGSYVEGQVGGDLAHRLASVADGLVLRGSSPVPRAVLAIDEAGRARLAPARFGPQCSTLERLERLGALHPGAALLCCGPAAERGFPVASLAAGGDPAHFVGRGGLGARLFELGLVALVIEAPARRAGVPPDWLPLLQRSPRLAERATQGTFELFDARAVELESDDRRESRESMAQAARTLRGPRHGCLGCPTPCGYGFRSNARAAPQPARFGAIEMLAAQLGLESFEQALELLSACDRVGADAKEVGRALALALDAGVAGAQRGDFERCFAAVEGLARGESAGEVELAQAVAGGVAALARRLGRTAQFPVAKGGALHPDRSPVELLGACVSSRGSDPMRSFAFLAGSGDLETLRRIVAPLPLPEGAEDPRDSRGKGRLVWWQENWSSALDATGFCAFTAAALLADGLWSAGALARELAPAAWGPRTRSASEAELAERWIGLGADMVHLQRRLNEAWGLESGADLPAPLRGTLCAPGLWGEYARLRGLDPSGRLSAAERARFDAGRSAWEAAHALSAAAAPPAAVQPLPAEPRSGTARIALCCSGALARELGARSEWTVALPCDWSALCRQVARERPGAAALLWVGDDRGGRPLPSAWRAGRALAPGAALADGDRIDLALVISGG